MFYTWANGTLTKTGASNLSGLIGTKKPEDSKFVLLKGTSEDYAGSSFLVYKKAGSEVFLVATKALGLSIFVKIESLQGLMTYLALHKELVDASDYIDTTYDEESEDADADDEAEESAADGAEDATKAKE